jgi:hypothetical protein
MTTALDRFFSHQTSIGRAALVAACLAGFAPSASAGEHYDVSKLGGVETVILDGEAQHYVSGAEGKKTLDFIVKHLNDDMNAIQAFALSVSVPNLAHPTSADVGAIKKNLKSALSELQSNETLREDFANLSVSSDMANFDAVEFLAQRANQRAHYVDEMEMRLKEVSGALQRKDYAAVSSAVSEINTGIGQQEYVEDGLRKMGFDTGR